MHGALVDLGAFFYEQYSSDLSTGGGTTFYSDSDDDLGVSMPTVLIPYDAPASDAAGPAPVVNRANLVQIKGTGHQDANLCVAPGFACGKNPSMPPASTLLKLTTSGPWQFATVSSSPSNIYVAMLTAPAVRVPSYVSDPYLGTVAPAVPADFTLGLFEAEPASKFPVGTAGFTMFQGQVMANNPLGTATFVEHDGSAAPWDNPLSCPIGVQTCPLVTDWTGTYKKTDGTIYNFTIAPPMNPNAFVGGSNDHLQLSVPFSFNGYPIPPPPSPPFWDDYPITSPNTTLPAIATASWDFADGPVQADHSGVITITSPRFHSTCRLDISDIHNPRRIGCDDLDGDQLSDTSDNCPLVYNPVQSNCNLDAEIASNNRSDSATQFLGDACDPVPCPLANMDATSTHATNCYTDAASEQTCYSRTTRSTIQLTPIGSHPAAATVPEGATVSSFNLSAAEAGPTSLRFCQPSVIRGIDCSPPSENPSANPFVFSQDQLSVATETGTDPAHPWHRITIDCQAPNTVAARIPAYALPQFGATQVAHVGLPNNFCGSGTVVYSPPPSAGSLGSTVSTAYGPDVVANHTWCYATDFQRWQQNEPSSSTACRLARTIRSAPRLRAR